MNIEPQQLSEWTEVLWSIGSKGLIVFVVIFYRELVIHAGKVMIDLLFKWPKK